MNPTYQADLRSPPSPPSTNFPQDEFFAEFDEESVLLKEKANKGIVAMQRAIAAMSLGAVFAKKETPTTTKIPQADTTQHHNMLSKIKVGLRVKGGALTDVDGADKTIVRDDTFKFTSSFNKIALNPIQDTGERPLQSVQDHILGAARQFESIVSATENPDVDDPNVNRNASFSMKEFDRMCRNFSDHADSPQKSYLVKSSELFLVPQPILVSHLWGVETDIDLTGRGFYSDYVAAFAETLKNGLRPGVHTIRMGSNRVDDDAALSLFDAIVDGNCQLEVLVLKDNEIGNKSMRKFAEFLKLGHLMEVRRGYERVSQSLKACYRRFGIIAELCTPPFPPTPPA